MTISVTTVGVVNTSLSKRQGMVDKQAVVTGQVYHVFSRSIAGYTIFNDPIEYSHMVNTVKFYTISEPPLKFSLFRKRHNSDFRKFQQLYHGTNQDNAFVRIIGYCIMPTHIHLIIQQKIDDGLSRFMKTILNSYCRYFNIKHKRKGPLWESRFKKVLVETDEQLLHLTRYVHLNPCTANIVNSPHEWPASSYKEYINGVVEGLCAFEDLLDIEPASYSEFVTERIDYQRDLARISHLLLD